jgi:prevent-host-death family protein
MGDSAYDDTTDITIPSRGENKLVVTSYAKLKITRTTDTTPR